MADYKFVPPPELVQQWRSEWIHNAPGDLDELGFLANCAAQWGADQELEACCEWFVREWTDVETADALRAARRPKPTLKEQALDVLKDLIKGIETADSWHVIQSALEQLDD